MITIDITASQPIVQITGIVRAPIDKVWALFRPFGDPIMKWWPIFEWVKLDAPGEDAVGAVRYFHTKTNNTYREKLVERDDARFFERYDMTEFQSSLNPIQGVATTVQMKDAGNGQTQVTWSSWTQATSMFMDQIRGVQEETYRGAITALDRAFNPALGTLDVRVMNASGLDNGSKIPFSLGLDAYVLVRLDDSAPQRTGVRHFTKSPAFDETLSFQVLSNQGSLSFEVWDSNLGRDTLLGSARFDAHALLSGKLSEQTLELTGGRGGKLEVGLTLTLTSGEALPLTEEQQELGQFHTVAAAINKIRDQAMALIQQVTAGPQPRYAYARYGRSPQIPDVPLEELPRMVQGLPPDQALSPHTLSRMAERGIEYLYSQAQFLDRLAKNEADPFRAYFGGWIKQPDHIVQHWQEDTELARQFIQGVGPMVIRVVTSLDQVPQGLRGLTPGGRGLEQLIADKSLFLLDYEALASLAPYRNMFFYAPYVLVYKERLPAGEDRLNLAAIQLTRGPGNNPVYTPGSSTPNRWLFAKMHVACADNQYHQWLFHLGYAHLAMEPFVVAWKNALPADHPISKLLAPHFVDTIGINFLARQTLVSDVAPFTDRTFSTGTAQALQMFLGAWKKYDFFERAFPAELAARGFDEKKSDGLEGYWFREDGFLVWNVLGDYARAIVDRFYADDAAVAGDGALQAWATESTDPARADIPGFPKSFATKALLASTLQTLIWAVSAQHSVVNFPQFEFLSYVPNRPDSLFHPMPPGDADIDLKYIREALPAPQVAHFQISFAWLLTLPSDLPLSEIAVYDDVFPLRKRLQEASARIRARNEKLLSEGKPPYPYLLPENIAPSIAV